jgi:hypothetical protein
LSFGAHVNALRRAHIITMSHCAATDPTVAQLSRLLQPQLNTLLVHNN